MAPRSLRSLEDYVRKLIAAADRADEVRRTERKSQRDYDGILPQPSYFQRDHRIWQIVNREKLSEEAQKAELKARLDHFQYPYPEGNKSGKTFSHHLASRALSDLLLESRVFSEIRGYLTLRRYREITSDQRLNYLAADGLPISFYRRAASRLFRHAKEMKRLIAQHKLNEGQFADYLAALDKQLLAVALLAWPRLATSIGGYNFKIPMHADHVDAQLSIFDVITDALRRKHVGNKILAYQLTALVCSPSDCVTRDMLCPTPENIRKNVRDRDRAACRAKKNCGNSSS